MRENIRTDDKQDVLRIADENVDGVEIEQPDQPHLSSFLGSLKNFEELSTYGWCHAACNNVSDELCQHFERHLPEDKRDAECIEEIILHCDDLVRHIAMSAGVDEVHYRLVGMEQKMLFGFWHIENRDGAKYPWHGLMSLFGGGSCYTHRGNVRQKVLQHMYRRGPDALFEPCDNDLLLDVTDIRQTPSWSWQLIKGADRCNTPHVGLVHRAPMVIDSPRRLLFVAAPKAD